jgi:hypothetical protein
MNQFIVLVVAAFSIAFTAAPAAQGQAGGGPVGTAPPSATPPGMNTPTENAATDEITKFGNFSALSKRLSKQDKANGKTVVDLLAQDKADATTLVRSLQLSCNVTYGILVTEGAATVDGATVNTRTFEVSCSNGIGYFLVSQQPGKPYGFSCFGADATRAADVAAGRKPSAVCELPANKDMKAMASAVLSFSGHNCPVRDYRWIGQSAKSNTDYAEVACSDRGYIVASPLPGSTAMLKVVACHDAYLQGIPCKLSDNGVQVITIQTFKDALAQYHVPCTTSDVRSVGLESVKKRHVVEFLCPEQPKGLVAFIPLEGNTAPFETVDCAAAAKRGIKCGLTK